MEQRGSAQSSRSSSHSSWPNPSSWPGIQPQREFFIDNLLVRILFIIVMIRWTGLAPWEFEFPFPYQVGGAERRDGGGGA